MAIRNHYDILGIQPTATSDEVKQAYRKLSLKFHPDKNEGDAFLADMFKSINQANEILSNSEKRKAYDQQLQEAETVRQRPDMHQATSNGTTRTASQVDDQLEDQVYALWNVYLDKQKIAATAYNKYMYARRQDAPKHVTTKKVLTSVAVLLLVWLFFKPTAELTASDTATLNEWVTNETVQVYKKPNIQSKVVGEIPTGELLKALDETTYFIKVDFPDGSGHPNKGFVRKSSLSHR